MATANQAYSGIEINTTSKETEPIIINVSSTRCFHCSFCTKYEYDYLKKETCCYCLGIRIAILLLCFMCIFDGLFALVSGPLILGIFASTPGTAFSVIDVIIGIIGILFGIYGFFGTWKMNTKILKTFYYSAIVVLIVMVISDSLLVILFFIDAIDTSSHSEQVTDEVMVVVFFCDMVSGVAIWGYCVYKIRQFYFLTALHYKESYMSEDISHITNVDLSIPEPFVWDESWSVSNAVIDEQHKEIMQCIVAVDRDRGNERRWQEFYDICKEHFEAEEMLMEKNENCKANLLVNHKAKHDAFLEKLDAVQERNDDVIFWAKDWYVKHVKVTDFKYKSFLKDSEQQLLYQQNYEEKMSETDLRIPEPFVWDESWTVLNAILDEQHRQIMECIVAVDGDRGNDGKWQQFYDVCKEHFEAEEFVMERDENCKKYLLVNHKATHDAFLQKCAAIKSRNDGVISWAKDWYVKHVKVTDFKYKAFLKDPQIDLSVPEPFVWDNSWTILNTVVDEQHKKIMECIVAVDEDRGNDAKWKAFYDICEEHFETEEVLMEKNVNCKKYLLVDHKAKHDAFLEKCATKKNRNDDVIFWAKDWYVKHVKVTDFKYKPFLKDYF